MARFKLSVISSAVLTLGFFTSCMVNSSSSKNEGQAYSPSFVEAFADFKREEKNLRQWDTAVVADLDQDGYPDLLLNDHGFAMRVMWNNKGKFSFPYDIIMGDMHGISVGDFNQDGQLDIIVSRGGGSGANARNSKIISVSKDRKFTPLANFVVPLELMRGRTVKFVDLDKDGDLDLLNFAFPSKEKKGQSENYIYKNNGEGQMVLESTIAPSQQNGQKTLITDFNQDNIPDMVVYGHGSAKAYLGNGDLSFKDVTRSVLPNIKHVTGVAEIDYDNDGDMDLFVTRGEEFYAGETFYEQETKTWGFFTKRGKFDFPGLTVGDILNVENLQSQWPNKDLYVGESAYDYAFPGENHSGRDIRLLNSDALGFAETMDKKGTYVGYVGNRQWRIAGDMWSPSTGIVHGVLSYKASEHKPGLADVLLENRRGKFVDVTAKQGLLAKQHSTGLAVADLDNNGYQDLVVRHRGNLVSENTSTVYLNTGKGFKLSQNHGVTTPELGAIGMSIQPIDYNLDGLVDLVIGNERGKWHLFKNTAESVGDYVTLDFSEYVSSQPSALGASVSVTACDNTQTQRIGATGANYSLSFNPLLHVGLGQCKQPVKVQVTWSDGSQSRQTISKVNQQIKIKR
ncbi:CRTAC1 family protein [Paraglaciecola sp.]|uniref:CRTAC1 family protein n=1 Tax=Paraglaciecola sp. TaxID=1920173 RepID=UPI003EF487B2